MLVAPIPCWVTATNAYVMAEEPGGLAVIVDAPPEPNAVVEVLKRYDLTAVAVLLTHGHVDHTGGAGELSATTGAAVYVHPDDDFLTLDPHRQLRAIFGISIPGSYEIPRHFEKLSDGISLGMAGLEFEVRHTPGHTPGHCCFYLEKEETLLSGDQLFAGSIGRTDLEGGSLSELMASMRDKVLVLPDAVRVLPGHGPETTIGRERRENQFLN